MYLVTLLFFIGSLFSQSFEGTHYANYWDCLDLIAQFIPEEPVIFEAGGHYGNDTALFCKKWPRSKIISFEPNPNAFKMLTEATRLLSNVQAHNLAVSDKNGTATMHICYGTEGNNPVFEGASSLLEASEWMKVHYQGPKITVPCVVLDDWWRENQDQPIDFMWLDLEGLELQVLRSSPQILKTVSVIYTETNFRPFRIGMTQYEELKTFLERNGFTMISHWYAENFQGNAIFINWKAIENRED